MTLDDFFTLTEMSNGLTSPSRVRELMAVMEKDRDLIVENVTDSIRQWSAVASAIAATENKDCLDLFLQLDGLHFMSKWFKDAQKSGNDAVDSCVEESIIHLLRALEKLDVDYGKLVASDIRTTLQNLLVHTSPKVQDKARELFESWKIKKESNTPVSDFDKAGTFTVDEAGKNDDIDRGMEHSESSPGDAPISRETSVNTMDHELAKDDQVLSTSYDTTHPDQVEGADNLDKILNPPTGNERSVDHVSSPSLPKSRTEPPPCHSVGITSEPCSAAVARQDTVDIRSEFHDPGSSNYTKQSLNSESLSEKLVLLEESNTPKGGYFDSSSDAVKEMKALTEFSPQRISTAGDKNSYDETLSCIDQRMMYSDRKCSKDEVNGANQFRTSRAFIAEGGDFNHHTFPRSFSNEKSWGNHTDLGTFLSGTEDDEKANTVGLHVNDNCQANNYTLGKKQMDREPDRAGKKSNVEIDYGIVDPLEVARMVALEVQREVVHYREPSCSSSENLPEGNTRQPNSPESVIGRKSHHSEGSPKEVIDDPNFSYVSSPMQKESGTSSENLDAEQTDGARDMATSQITGVAQEASNEEKGPCSFDLNQEVGFEDSDHPGNQFSTPVSTVSTSRAAAAQELPRTPLQFEGNLCWKGSAVTSVFHPASPCPMPECDKEDPSTGGSSRQGCLYIDLNVVENIDPRIGDLLPDTHVHLYSRVPSGESSVETSSRKSEHLGLDLNHTSEDGCSILDWGMGQYFPQGHHHHSRPHSSLSSKQPARNIDLNDQPSHLNDSSINTYLSPSQDFNVSGDIKSDDSVISIMGTRVEVNRKYFVSQTTALSNGRTTELAFDGNLGRTGNFLGIGSAVPYTHSSVPYTHSSVYGYNNIAPLSSMPFSLYGSGGPIPYMVDSRGQPVIPPNVGSASSLATAFSQPPFVINMNSSIPSNAVGPSRNSFDLNSGMLVECGSKDPAGLGLFLNPSQVRSVDELRRPNSQRTISSVISGKRKEPENGSEHYPFKQYTPPWKQS